MPCHFPETDGKDARLDNYDSVRTLVNDILYRIELQPHERGFMPEKDKRLPDSTIRLFHQWKKQGMVR
jgi:hypothetical protein